MVNTRRGNTTTLHSLAPDPLDSFTGQAQYFGRSRRASIEKGKKSRRSSAGKKTRASSPKTNAKSEKVGRKTRKNSVSLEADPEEEDFRTADKSRRGSVDEATTKKTSRTRKQNGRKTRANSLEGFETSGAKSRAASPRGRKTRANSFSNNAYGDIIYEKLKDKESSDYVVGEPKNGMFYDDENYIKTRAQSRAVSRATSRAVSRAGSPDNERPKTKIQSWFSSNPGSGSSVRDIRKGNLDSYRAVKPVFFENGKPLRAGVTYRFQPGRDVVNMDILCDILTLKFPSLPSGCRYIFNQSGTQINSLDEIENYAYYICSSDSRFKPGNYGANRKDFVPKRGGDVPTLSSTSSLSSNGSAGGGPKPGSKEGRLIRVINKDDNQSQGRVLLNLKTKQSFESTLDDLGQVLEMKKVAAMYTLWGQEVKSFSQLRNDFAELDSFYLEAAKERSAEGKTKGKGGKKKSSANNDPLVHTEQGSGGSEKPETRKVTIRGRKYTFAPPKNVTSVETAAPEEVISLDWVYGYRGWDSKLNLWVLRTEELLYYVAAVAIVFDRYTDRQRHYLGHTEDITCMAYHPRRDLVASGQRHGRTRKSVAHVRIWSTKTMETLHVIGTNDFRVGVAAVAFSVQNGGSFLAAADSGEDHMLWVYQWESESHIGNIPIVEDGETKRNVVWGVKFHPQDNNLLVTYGRGVLSYWMRQSDGKFSRNDILEMDPSEQTIISCAEFLENGDLVTADSDGRISLWSDEDLEKPLREIQAHESSVSSLLLVPAKGLLVTGSEKDRKITSWRLDDFSKLDESKLPEIAGGVRTLVVQEVDSLNLLVGTTRNLILEGNIGKKFNPVVIGHSKQLWALAVHPKLPVFATAGYDRNILKWKDHRPEWRVQVQSESTSTAFSPDGNQLSVGSIDGHVTVLRGDTGKHVVTFRVANAPLSCLTYHPDGSHLAVGSQNGSFYVYRSERGGYIYRKLYSLDTTQPLAHLDWSLRGDYIRAESQDHAMSVWNLKTSNEETADNKIKDIEWTTQSCTLSWSTAGKTYEDKIVIWFE
ncbi:unnamed protein product [Cyprideis torosa]|uniref:Uncharacterized protein n=1 Tax=Cyprideis torosa TaxID=163714 RepID=A0A7R8W578_9CRUS|nr:unnamed protein product [Cyprideis torosa]CAG0880321.1 unnamed protein product [Cyprideis torosa]